MKHEILTFLEQYGAQTAHQLFDFFNCDSKKFDSILIELESEDKIYRKIIFNNEYYIIK